MSTKRLPIDVDYLISEYLAGKSQPQLARELGFSQSTIWAKLKAAGITGHRNFPKTNSMRIDLPMGDVLSLYNAGKSPNAIGRIYGVDRGVVRKRLLEAGIPLRGMAEANALMMTQRTPGEHARNTRAAHDAARGRQHTPEERCKMAKSIERNQSNISPNETILAAMLAARGIVTAAQKAVGPYNCDLAAFPVAVEVWGGYFHYFGRHLTRTPKRCRYFFDRGWTMLIVHVGRTLRRITDDGADYIAAFVQQARSDPAFRSEYRMIWGTGELIAASCTNDNEAAIVETLRRAKDAIRNDPLTTW